MTGFPTSSVTLCDIRDKSVNFLYFPTGIKALSLQAVLAMTNIFISLFGTLANGLIIMAYYRSPRLRTVQNKIFFLLAITDIGATAICEPVFVGAILTGLLGNHSCILWGLETILSFLFLDLSLVTIVILSLQSYITLAYPYRWQSLITKSRLNLVFVFSWLLISLKTLTIFQHYNFVLYGALCILGLTIITVVFTWCWTYKLIARHRKAIQTTQSPASSQNMAQKKILRSTITAFAIILSLLACYFLSLCLSIFQNFLNASTLGHNTYGILRSLAITLMYLNSLLNSCLVFWRSTCFREAVKNIFE
jgi:hypothetical protein